MGCRPEAVLAQLCERSVRHANYTWNVLHMSLVEIVRLVQYNNVEGLKPPSAPAIHLVTQTVRLTAGRAHM